MNKKESLALYKQGKEVWNAWANDMLAKKYKLEKERQWEIDDVKKIANQAAKEWIAKASVDFSECHFQEEMDLFGFIFPYKANFSNTDFSDVARFGNIIFNDDVNFENAKFYSSADFTNVKFIGGARFGKAKFSKFVRFNNAVFDSKAWFDNVTFDKNAMFVDATFSDNAYFETAIFSGEAFFIRAKFCANAWLAKVQFKRVAKFESVEFNVNARFHNVTFYEDMLFDQVLFKGFADFSNTHFQKKISFIAIHGNGYFSFKNTKFYFVPDFNQAHFIEAPQFDEADFSKVKTNRQHDANGNNNISSKWRSLKRLAIQAHDHKSELFFFAEEIKSQRGIQDKPFPNLLNYFDNKPVWPGGIRYYLGYLYQFSSDFGRSVIWPLFWLLVLSVLSYNFYLKCSIEDKPTPTHGDSITQCDRSEAAIYLSARSALPFLPASSYSEKINRSYDCLYGKNSDGKANIPNAIICISIIQTILSTILIFLSLLALRNHFKIN